MENNTTKVKKVLYMDDKLPFGKYKGLSLSEVKERDRSYVDWLEKNVTNYQFEWNVNKSWCFILDVYDTAPDDGVYVMACRGDNHIIYEFYCLSKGDRFWDKYEGENAHSNGWLDVDCLAYWRIEEYSELSPEWSKPTEIIAKKDGFLAICAVVDKLDNLLYYESISEITGFEGVTIKGYRYIPRFTEQMHGLFWDMWRSKHPKPNP